MIDRLLVDIGDDDLVSLSVWLAGEQLPERVGEPVELAWPLDDEALEDLRWYLEDYLRYPYAVYSDRGSDIAERLPDWGKSLFFAIFGSAAARAAYAAVRARGNAVELVFQSASPRRLGLPWELMVDPDRDLPIALDRVAVTRSLPVRDLAGSFPAAGTRLRVLMVISRPAGRRDVAYRMIARPLLRRLEAVRGNVDLVVLRPPTLDRLRQVLTEAAEAGEPFQVVHFDGHGVFGEERAPASPLRYAGPGPRGMLVFERADGGPDRVPAEKVAQVLSAGRVPVAVLNACRSGQVGAEVEAAVATRLVQGGAASVVAMAYSVYAVAAAEFMAAFYERLFAGDRIADAVTAGRARLALRDERPSPKGSLPLADWVVPVHYSRRDIRFPGLRTERSGASLNTLLDRLRAAPDGDAETGADLAPVGTFVGRDDLFYALESAARLQRVVILHGPGGTGKTELAKAFGRWWRDTGGVGRPDWVIWHSYEPGVASFSLDGVVNAVGRRVFGTDFVLNEPAERARIVRRLLAEQRLLLIWDNFESVRTLPGAAAPGEGKLDELKDFLARIARSGKSSVLITSRTGEDWLGDLRRIEVGGLSPEEAVDHAEQLLSPFPRARPRRGMPRFAELMEWLDGHPLSMRLILPHLDTTDAGVLLSALRGTIPLPGGDGGDRTTSLRACVAYSFTHLSASDRRALVAVALFHGVVSASILGALSLAEDAPERFRGLSGEDWDEALSRAAAIGLLSKLPSRMYRLHPALPAYLIGEWRAGGPDAFDAEHAATVRAFLDACAAYASWLEDELAGRDAGWAAALIDLHQRTLHAMLGHALDRGLWEQARNITQPFVKYWDIRGLAEEARGWCDRARLALGTPDGGMEQPAVKYWLLAVATEANWQLRAGELDVARRTYLDLLEFLDRQPGSDARRDYQSVAYHQLGVVAREQERWAEAEQWYRKATENTAKQGDPYNLALGYQELGALAVARECWEEAERWLNQARVIHESAGERRQVGVTYHGLGVIAEIRERLDEAEEWLGKAITVFEAIGDRRDASACYHHLGIVAQRRGRPAAAEELLGRSLALEEELGNRPGLAGAYGQLGLVAIDRGRPVEALAWLVRCVAVFEEFPHPATTPGPALLKALTQALGLPELEKAWQAATGHP
ncbi:tetratricopeptide repeat protein, partial [Nonomuraea zeae]